MKPIHRASITVSALSIALALWGLGCATDSVTYDCVAPPPTTIEHDTTNAFKLSAELNQLNTKGDVEAQFNTLAKWSFQNMSDVNTTLMILIDGAQCMLKRKDPISPELARKLIDTATKIALAKLGVAAAFTGELSPTQTQALKQGPAGDAVIRRLQDFGIKAQQGD